MGVEYELLLVMLLLVATVLVVRQAAVTLRFVVHLQVAFWTLAYVIHPIVWLLVTPSGQNPLADVRYEHLGYAAGLKPVLLSVAIGQAAYLVGLAWLVHRSSPSARREVPTVSWSSVDMRSAVSLYLIGLTGRSIGLAGVNAAGLALSPLATPAACLIAIAPAADARTWRRRAVILTASEAAFAVLTTSKTPIIALLIAFALRSTMHGPNTKVRSRNLMVKDRQRGRTLQRYSLFVAAVFAFLTIQPLKGIDTASMSQPYVQQHKVILGDLYALVTRADGIQTILDAQLYPQRPWMGTIPLAEHVLQYGIPHGALARQLPTDGLLWTQQVRTESLPHQFQGVSIAFGPIAEGYVEGGYLGVIIAELFFAGFVALVCRSLAARSQVLAVAGAFYIFGTGLLERGLLSGADGLSKCVEAAAFVLLIRAIIRTNPTKHSRGRVMANGRELPEELARESSR